MDFESYIGKERQLLSRIERERAEMNSHEPDAWKGNYQMAADEIKLLQAGDYVMDAAGTAADAIAALDERMTELRQIEAGANARNETFLKRVEAWETKFDMRYAEVMASMAREMAAMEARNAELTKRIEAAEQNLQDITRKSENSIRETREIAETSLKDVSSAEAAYIDRLVGSLRAAQSQFEASISEKLEQDKQTLEKIKFMIATMNDIIKT